MSATSGHDTKPEEWLRTTAGFLRRGEWPRTPEGRKIFCNGLCEVAECIEAMRQNNVAVGKEFLNSHEALIGALERAQAAMWDSYYGNGIDLGYVQTVDRQIRAALAQAGVK